MLLTDYTTFDEVRAALGVSDDDIEDGTLESPLYADTLQIELEDVHINLPTTYDMVRALATPSSDQSRFLQAAHLFATYAVARQLTSSLPLFSPEQITDGKASMTRPSSNPHQKVTDGVLREYARFRSRLDQMFSVINASTSTTAVTKNYFGIITPSVDVVTGV